MIFTIYGCIVGLLYFYQLIYGVIGLFIKAKKYPKTENKHKYAFLVCAHNEEKVVGNLVNSIYQSNYPKELIKVFVVADNCTDKTKEVAENAGAVVFTRFSDIKGKSYALDLGIKNILKDYSDEGFEALFLFDADNIVDKDYLIHMNEMFDSGVKIGYGFRDSKNYNDNTLAACHSLMFYQESYFIHHCRTRFNIGTYVAGTGFYMDFDIVKEMGGWNYHALSEDLEFSCDYIARGINPEYNEEAIFFDEQPTTMKGSKNQLLRWARGTFECFIKYTLRRDFTKNNKGNLRSKYQMGMHISFFPQLTVFMYSLLIIISIIDVIINHQTFLYFFHTAIVPTLSFILFLWLMFFFHGLGVMYLGRKRIHEQFLKQLKNIFVFPFFMIRFWWFTIVVTFKKVQWVKIDHNSNKTLKDLNK